MKHILTLLTLLLTPLAALHAADRPNIVLFLVDDMGWMDSSVYGSKYYETPNMDRLAKRSMRFTNAYAQPLCSPTRASLLTGQSSARHGITSATGHVAPQPEGHAFIKDSAPPSEPMLMPESKNYLEPAQITLAEALKGAGYRTAHIGKWHLGLTLQQQHRAWLGDVHAQRKQTPELKLARPNLPDPAYDIVVYGDSSGAVVAAIAAKRERRSVIWVNPSGFPGGMSSSGLAPRTFSAIGTPLAASLPSSTMASRRPTGRISSAVLSRTSANRCLSR